MILTGKERYRWLTDVVTASGKVHAFIEGARDSLCLSLMAAKLSGTADGSTRPRAESRRRCLRCELVVRRNSGMQEVQP